MPTSLSPSRRSVLGGLAAASAAGLVGARPARAASGAERNFLFVTCFGGWDPTRALVPAFDSPLVAMEPQAEPWRITDHLTVVDHPFRPSQRDFFSTTGDRLAVVHGVLVPSVAHMACLSLARTGALSGSPDWPAILAAANGADAPVPHIAVSGPSYPAELGPYCARSGAGGQLKRLVAGDLFADSELPVTLPPSELVALQQALVAERRDAALERAVGRRHRAALEGHAVAQERAAALQDAGASVTWDTTGAFADDCLLATELLGAGLARCVSVAHPALWDSHSENEVYQNILWEDLFFGLTLLTDALASTPGQRGGTLADETVVVVLSEMGRSPTLNANNGKDHWPYASLLLWGPGVSAGRSIGGYDDAFRGAPLDRATGAVSSSGSVLSCVGLGATLLALGDVDPGDWVPGEDPVTALLEG